jgi:hypothetical protein
VIWWTIVPTVMLAAPMIIGTSLMLPVPGGGLEWRALGSIAYPWLPANAVMMWGFAIIASTVISSVIYRLRTEAREAAGSASMCSSGNLAREEWVRSTGPVTA